METGEPRAPVHAAPRARPAGAALLLWSAAFKVAKWMALGAGIFACFLLLGMISLTGETPGRIKIDSITGNPHSERLHLHGSARPGDVVEILSGDRRLDITFADWRGNFEAFPIMPPEAHGLWARVLARDESAEIARTGVAPLPRSGAPASPRIALAFFIQDSRELWIAGYADPSQELHLRSEKNEEIARLEADGNGCFDFLGVISPDRQPPVTVSLSGPAPESIAVDSVTAGNLPLSRTADIQVRAWKPGLLLRVTLPSAHPYAALLEKGLISAKDFGNASFGGFPGGEGEVRLVSFQKSAGRSVVELEQSWAYVLPELIWLGSGLESQSIGQRPLLTRQDRIAVHFQDIKPAWFGELPPSMVTGDQALWQGPLTMEKNFDVGFRLTDFLRVYRSLPEAQQTAAEKKGEDEKFSDFVRNLGEHGGATLQSILYQLVLLIPFAGLIALRLRARFGNEKPWRALVATALIMALWRISSAAAPLFLRLGRLLGALQVVRDSQGGPQLSTIVPQAFWITFAFLAATLPAAWRYLASVDFFPTLVSVHRRGWLRRLGLGARSAYVATVSVLYVAIAYHLFRPVQAIDLPPDFYSMAEWLSLPLCLCLFLWAFGFRALLMGVGFTLVAFRQYAEESKGLYLDLHSELERVASVPQWVFAVFAVIAACPFLFLLVRRLTGAFLSRWRALLLTAGLVTSALVLPRLPVRMTLLLAGSLLLFGFAGVLLRLLLGFFPGRPWARFVASRPWTARGILYAGCLILTGPMTGPETRLEPGMLQILNLQIQDLFVYGLALGLTLLLWDYASKSPSPIVSSETLGTGIYLFAVLLVNSYNSWLLVPVPFLVGLLIASTWLFRPEGEVQHLREIPEAKLRRLRHLIRDVIDYSTSGEQFSKIQKALTEKLNSAELSPEEYEKKREEYQLYLDKKLELEAVTKDVQSREAVFAVGGPVLLDNVKAALRTGSVLAAGPFLIALYQFLPYSRVRYPYPLMTLVSFIISAAASWLLYSFFLGFYYTCLRGTSGLAKGIHLFLALGLPFAVYRLLSAENLTSMTPFLFWVTQLFLFCSLLGLFAFDYRLLRENGFRLRDLTAVHNVPALSAYASTVVAALIPTVTALVTGQFKGIMKFFLETVLGLPSPS